SCNQVDTQFSKSTLNRAATCIQCWWRGFIVRHRWNYLKKEVCFSHLLFSFQFIQISYRQINTFKSHRSPINYPNY
ncbi:unnamed protein product, partial [Rotaria sp. Silwood2]